VSIKIIYNPFVVKLVIFDWNGTLIADTVAIVKTSNLIFQKLKNKTVDIKFLRENFRLPLSDFYMALGDDEKVAAELAHEHALIFYSNYEGFITKIRTRSGAKEALSYLKQKGVRAAIFSNHISEKIHPHLKRLKIDTLIDAVVANDSGLANTREKNKEEKIRKFLKEEKVRPDEAIIVGDSLEEIEIGKNLGMKSVAVEDGNYSTKRLREAKPDYLVSNLKEIIKIIELLNTTS
jgi:phosphoglycolate phosphatase